MSLILAPPPEYTASGGWTLRGAPPKGLSSRPATGPTGSPDKPGMMGKEMPEKVGHDEGDGDDE